jgi:hypothetical protein
MPVLSSKSRLVIALAIVLVVVGAGIAIALTHRGDDKDDEKVQPVLETSTSAPSITQQTASVPNTAPASITVDPPTQTLNINPGQTTQREISVTNTAATDFTVSASSQNFTAGGESGEASLYVEAGRHSLSEWVTISPAVQTIGAHQTARFTVVIKAPTNASAGGHFGAVVFSPKAMAGETASQVTSLALVSVAGEVRESARLLNVLACGMSDASCVNSPNPLSSGPVVITARVENQGDDRIQPQGTVDVFDAKGERVTSASFVSSNVLPQAIRRFTAQLPVVLPAGTYTAKVGVTYGSGHPVLTGSETFVIQ